MKLVFYKGRKTWFSHLIYLKQRYLDGLPKKIAIYTHVELFFDNKVMYSSSEHDGGVRGRYMPNFKDHWDFVEINLEKDQIEAIFKWCESRDGSEYDIKGILFAQALKTNWFLDKDKWFCSEFCTAALQVGGLKEVSGISPHLVTPGDLYKLINV